MNFKEKNYLCHYLKFWLFYIIWGYQLTNNDIKKYFFQKKIICMNLMYDIDESFLKVQ